MKDESEISIKPFRLYNKDKWLDIIDDKKYQDIREKILNAFNELVFDEEPHKYYLHGVEIDCVSNVTHRFQEHFDADKKAQETFERRFNDPNSKYFGMTVEEIKQSWVDNSKHACSHGTERHEFGESCFYFMCGKYDKILDAYKDRLHKDENGDYYFEAKYAKEAAAAKYYDDMPRSIVPILAETKVYSVEDGYSGTFDLLTYYDATLDGKDDSKSGLIVNDWKSNKDLYKNFNGKRLLAPFTGLLDMPLSLYKLQLSLYQNCLEIIGLKVIARRIMWLLPSGEYEKIKLEEYVKTLKEALKKEKNLLI